MINNWSLTSVKLIKIKVFDALVTVELISRVILVTNLTLDFNLWAFKLDMVVELNPCHELELGKLAYVTAKLGTMELGVCLQLT